MITVILAPRRHLSVYWHYPHGVLLVPPFVLLTFFCFYQYEGHEYRDRAAERRALHGGFGVGPGQKGSIGDAILPSSPPVEEAAAEALEMSFGAGSYAHKILKTMGWKEVFVLQSWNQWLDLIYKITFHLTLEPLSLLVT